MVKSKSKKSGIIVKMNGAKKRGPGRPRKDVIIKEIDLVEGVGLPGMLQPTEHDIHDELSRLDSFAYGNRY